MSKTAVTQLQDTVRAWVVSPEQAKTIEEKDLAALQRQFEDKLAIIHQNNGSIVIYPSVPGDRTEFDTFMAANGSFTPRPVEVTKI